MGKHWSQEEIQYLKENFSIKTDDEIALKLKRDSGSVFYKRYNLKLLSGHKRLDISIGDKFGEWTVLNISKIKVAGKLSYDCICSCGKLRTIKGPKLKSGRNKDCKCNQIHTHEINNKKPPGQASLNHKENSYKLSAKFRKIDWKLTTQEFKDLCGKNCHYCDSAPRPFNMYLKRDGSVSKNFLNVKETTIERQWININGVDRLNNEKSYTVDNAVTCCEQCNYMKLDYSFFEFASHCKKIADFQKGKI